MASVNYESLVKMKWWMKFRLPNPSKLDLTKGVLMSKFTKGNMAGKPYYVFDSPYFNVKAKNANKFANDYPLQFDVGHLYAKNLEDPTSDWVEIARFDKENKQFVFSYS